VSPILWVLVLVLLISAILAFRAANQIVAPINALDLENVRNNPYLELAPLLDKIEEQKLTESSNSEAQPQSTEQAIELKEVTAKNLQGINDLVKELFPEYGKSFKSSEKAVEYFKERGYNLVIE
jgi:hypothetical protein